jgi:hypoxanthine phosphoribosyltransferase
MDWKELDKHVNYICDSIKNDRKQYDYIVGISRGGVIPATMISYKLGIPLKILNISFRDFKSHDDNHFKEQVSNDKRCLIVEDIIDSGKTYREVNKFLHNYTFDWAALICNSEVITNVLDLRLMCKLMKRSETDEWFMFPWDK